MLRFSRNAQKVGLLLASHSVIFAVTETYLVSLFLTVFSAASFLLVLLLDKIKSPKRQSWLHMLIVVVTFGSLYALNLGGFIGTLSGSKDSTLGQSVLFIGINFYALFVCGVMISVVRGEIVRPALLDFVLATAFAPKFFSGPLENGRFAHSFNRMSFSRERLWEGLHWILLGLYMTLVVSRNLSPLIDLEKTAPADVLFTTIIFELKFYFNFAGFSFLAFGIAKIINVDLTLNFLAPLHSRNVVDLWRRWHISFGRWFRDYLYTPIARSGRVDKTLIAALVFLCSGLWHGVTVNFAMWLSFHVVCYTLYQKVFKNFSFSEWAGRICMIAYIVFSRLLFTEYDTERLFEKLLNFTRPELYALPTFSDHIPYISLVACCLALSFIFQEGKGCKRDPQRPYDVFFSPFWAITHMSLLILLGRTLGGGAIYGRA